MKKQEVINKLEEIFPLELAYDWDKNGLMIGDLNEELTTTLVAFEITNEIIEEAVEIGANLIISHHPFIFKELTNIDMNTPKGKMIKNIIKHDISIYSMHTNVDNSPIGMNAWLMEVLELTPTDYIDYLGNYKDNTNEENYDYGLGMIANVNPISLEEIAQNIKINFALNKVKVVGELDKEINSIAIVGGSGTSLIPKLQKKADLLITGDIGFHSAIEALSLDIALIDMGHSVEIIFNDVIADILNANEIKAYASNLEIDPFTLV